jgi:hypothetical protein
MLEHPLRQLVEEAPAAYRDIGEILQDQEDLVRRHVRLEPVAVLKGDSASGRALGERQPLGNLLGPPFSPTVVPGTGSVLPDTMLNLVKAGSLTRTRPSSRARSISISAALSTLGATGLMIRWGDPAVTAGQAQLPVLGAGEVVSTSPTSLTPRQDSPRRSSGHRIMRAPELAPGAPALRCAMMGPQDYARRIDPLRRVRPRQVACSGGTQSSSNDYSRTLAGTWGSPCCLIGASGGTHQAAAESVVDDRVTVVRIRGTGQCAYGTFETSTT